MPSQPFVALSTGLSLWERLALWYRSSVFSELFGYLWAKYFTVHFGEYDHFTVSASTATTVRNLLVALFLGLAIASFAVAYTRVRLGRFVRRLVARECLSPERALTLRELGFFRDSAVRRELARGVNLRKLVKIVPNGTKSEEKPQAKGLRSLFASSDRPDFLHDRFYLPEDLRIRAELRYDRAGSSYRAALVTTLVLLVVTALLCWLLPDLLQLADNVMGLFSPN